MLPFLTLPSLLEPWPGSRSFFSASSSQTLARLAGKSFFHRPPLPPRAIPWLTELLYHFVEPDLGTLGRSKLFFITPAYPRRATAAMPCVTELLFRPVEPDLGTLGQSSLFLSPLPSLVGPYLSSRSFCSASSSQILARLAGQSFFHRPSLLSSGHTLACGAFVPLRRARPGHACFLLPPFSSSNASLSQTLARLVG